MDSEANLLLDRADNELLAAKALHKLSEDNELKISMLLPPKTTFYSSVIGHSYYCIFYSAKAYLIHKDIKLSSEQGQHQQVYFKFKQFVQKGVLQSELLKIYDDIKLKAEKLLEILHEEKEKRKIFTYQTIPQANKSPAEDSIKNANFFISHIKSFISAPKKNESPEDQSPTPGTK